MNPLDLFDIAGSLSEEERMVQDSVARMVDEKVLPVIQKCFEEHRYPKELLPELAGLGLLGSTIKGYDCAGLNAINNRHNNQKHEQKNTNNRNNKTEQTTQSKKPNYAFG